MTVLGAGETRVVRRDGDSARNSSRDRSLKEWIRVSVRLGIKVFVSRTNFPALWYRTPKAFAGAKDCLACHSSLATGPFWLRPQAALCASVISVVTPSIGYGRRPRQRRGPVNRRTQGLGRRLDIAQISWLIGHSRMGWEHPPGGMITLENEPEKLFRINTTMQKRT
jgi:hypothetical protein